MGHRRMLHNPSGPPGWRWRRFGFAALVLLTLPAASVLKRATICKEEEPPDFQKSSRAAMVAVVEDIKRGRYCQQPVTLQLIQQANPGCCDFRQSFGIRVETSVCYYCPESPKEIMDVHVELESLTSNKIHWIGGQGPLGPYSSCPPQFGFESLRLN